MLLSSQTTRVIILAAAALHRAAWAALLAQQPAVQLLAALSSPDELEAIEPPSSATTVLIDLPHFPPDLIPQLAAALPNSGLLFLVERYELEQIVSLLQAGATGCLIRDASVNELARALIASGRGEIVLPPALAARALAALARGEIGSERPVANLTRRETDVLTLLAQGLTNKDIAQSLFLSVRTVEAHLRNIYGKLHVASRTEAALWAMNHKLSDFT